MTEPLAVLYEDAHVLAVDKPAGLLTQGRPAGEPTLEQAVRRYLATGAAGSNYLGTVHRLDRPVSGVVVWAKTSRAARRLAAQFASRETVKDYWAVAESRGPGGDDRASEGVWVDWLAGAADVDRVVRAVAPETPGARQAVTRYRVDRLVGLPEGTVWLRLRPETGRTHQIRAQAGLRGMPVWGDTAYGAERRFPVGIALHARALTFRHPTLLREITITSPPPETWRAVGIHLPSSPPFAGKDRLEPS